MVSKILVPVICYLIAVSRFWILILTDYFFPAIDYFLRRTTWQPQL